MESRELVEKIAIDLNMGTDPYHGDFEQDNLSYYVMFNGYHFNIRHEMYREAEGKLKLIKSK